MRILQTAKGLAFLALFVVFGLVFSAISTATSGSVGHALAVSLGIVAAGLVLYEAAERLQETSSIARASLLTVVLAASFYALQVATHATTSDLDLLPTVGHSG